MFKYYAFIAPSQNKGCYKFKSIVYVWLYGLIASERVFRFQCGYFKRWCWREGLLAMFGENWYFFQEHYTRNTFFEGNSGIFAARIDNIMMMITNMLVNSRWVHKVLMYILTIPLYTRLVEPARDSCSVVLFEEFHRPRLHNLSPTALASCRITWNKTKTIH